MNVEDVLVIVCLCASLLLGVVLGYSTFERKIQKEAIAHGAAQYNPTNGTFEWKELK